MELDHDGLISDLLDESDLCRNEGVEDLADLLEKAATHIKALMKVEADLRGACMSMAMEMTK